MDRLYTPKTKDQKEANKIAREDEELKKNYTFKPSLATKKPGAQSSSNGKVYDRLYDHASAIQARKEALAVQFDEQARSECSFRPKLEGSKSYEYL